MLTDPLNGQNVEEGKSSRSTAVYVPDWTDILERFENLQDDYNMLVNAHAECLDIVQKLVTAHQDLEHNARLYTDAINHYKNLKEEHAGLARKDSALTAAKRMSTEEAQERQKLVAQPSKTEVEKFDYIRKLLPTIVSQLLKSHEYNKSLLEPFNMAIQAG
ncbi:hypothetical protein Tco_1340335 [Tanacetum coccineum]